jgi:signal transduction histidine kinase/FixJ family two-component response regulator
MNALFAFFENPTLRMAFLISLHGCALLIVGVLALAVREPPQRTKALACLHWRWLGWFGVLKGASVFGCITAGVMNSSASADLFSGLYLGFALPAYAAVGWLGVTDMNRCLRVSLITVIAGGCLLAAVLGGLHGVERVFPWLVAAPCGIVFLVTVGRRMKKQVTIYWPAALGLAGLMVGMAGLIGLELGGRDYYQRFQGWTANTLEFYVRTDGGKLGWAAVFAWVALVGWWCWVRVQSRDRKAGRRAATVAVWVLPVVVVVAVVGGFAVIQALNAGAIRRAGDLTLARLKTAALLVEAQRPEHWPETLKALGAANPDVHAVQLAVVEGGRLRLMGSSNERIGLNPEPTDWRKRGARDEHFFSSAREAFVASVMEDENGRFVLGCLPWNERDGGWFIFRIEEAVWIHFKGPVMVQATVIILLAAFLGISGLVVLLQREAEGEQRHAREQAEAVARARGESLAFLSHELRTPLQNVLGFADLLGLASLQVVQRRHLGAIQSQGRLLLHLVNDFLDLAAFDAGRLAIRVRPVRLHEMVRECVEAVRPRAESKGLTLRLSIGANVPSGVWADETRVRQILGNLLGNAVKFTVEGSVSLAMAVDGADVIFAIEDTGPGISAERKTVLFQPFERGAAGVEGTGLGLALTRRLCVAMGGTVELSGVQGTGAVFTVRLPLIRCAPPDVKSNLAAVTEGRRLDVLVVDDHPLIRELLVTLLQKLGHRPVAVASGEEAVAEFIGERFDVVLLDLNLAGIDGIDTARQLRKQVVSEGREVRLIGLSAEVSPTEQERARAEGIEVFLVKPVPLAVLAELLPPVASSREGSWAEAGQEEGRERWRATFIAGLGAAVVELRELLATRDWDALGAAVHHLHNGAIAAGDRGWLDVCARLAATVAQRRAEDVKTVLAGALSKSLSGNSV